MTASVTPAQPRASSAFRFTGTIADATAMLGGPVPGADELRNQAHDAATILLTLIKAGLL